jgi:hypothetical protein
MQFGSINVAPDQLGFVHLLGDLYSSNGSQIGPKGTIQAGEDF